MRTPTVVFCTVAATSLIYTFLENDDYVFQFKEGILDIVAYLPVVLGIEWLNKQNSTVCKICSWLPIITCVMVIIAVLVVKIRYELKQSEQASSENNTQ